MPIKVRFTSDFSNIAIENINSDDDFDFVKNSISKFYLEPLKEEESKIWIRLMDFWQRPEQIKPKFFLQRSGFVQWMILQK